MAGRMRLRHLSTPSLCGLLGLFLLPSCGSDQTGAGLDALESVEADQTEVAADGKGDAVSSYTYYTVRPDLRRCLSPLCGGYFVKRVNQTYTYCPGAPNGGWTDGECYVAEADFSAAGLSSPDGSLWKGTVVSKTFDRFGNLHRFVGTEAWRAAGTTAASGTFYRANDLGIRCITTPCASLRETKLNSSVGPRAIAGLDLSRAGASDADVQAAYAAAQEPAGVLVAGKNVTISGPAGRALSLEASQFFLRVRPAGCDYDGAHHDAGTSFPSTDGCNTCSCGGSGLVACTKRLCLRTCEYGGATYTVGQSFPSTDGCNTCSCTPTGTVACTERACVADWNKHYVGTPAQCPLIRYTCIPGTTAFSDARGCGCEQPADCPQWINCQPPRDCSADRTRCPFSQIAW